MKFLPPGKEEKNVDQITQDTDTQKHQTDDIVKTFE
jgi:hypothetical protein